MCRDALNPVDASRQPGGSQLPQQVQDLVSQLFDVRQAESTMSTLSYELDTRKMPLGKISAGTIRSGYEILKEIEELLDTVGGGGTDEIQVNTESTSRGRDGEDAEEQDSDATEEEDEGVAASAAKEARAMDDNDSVIWYWKGDSKKSAVQDIWIRYDASTCAALEEARGAKEKKYQLDDERFIDIGKMVQARYDDPKRRRALKRETPAARRAALKRKATMAAKTAAARQSKSKPAGNTKRAPKRGAGSAAAAASGTDVDTAQIGHGASADSSTHEPLILSELPIKVRQGLLDASTRFYSKIPHSFGSKSPPILLSKEQLKEKILLLDELLQLERTAQVIRSANSDGPSSAAETTQVPRSPIDACYDKLHCDLNVLKTNSSEYQLVQEMLTNTHGDTHRNFSLSKSLCSGSSLLWVQVFVLVCCSLHN